MPVRSSIVACDACGTKNRVPDRATGVPRCGKCGAALPWITDSGDEDFDEVVGAASLPVLVDLWATWCGPCRLVGPALEQLAHELAGKLKLVKVDVDAAPAVARRLDVQSIPTLLLVVDGAAVSRRTGAAPLDDLRRWVGEVLRSRTS